MATTPTAVVKKGLWNICRDLICRNIDNCFDRKKMGLLGELKEYIVWGELPTGGYENGFC